MDRIERQNQGRLEVIRLNVQEPVGAALGDEMGFQYTPTFIFFDARGEEVWRMVGAIDPEAVQGSLEGH